MQVEVKGRVNLDKLTAFVEQLPSSKSRTVSLGTLMSARDASAADKTHLVEVRWSLYARHRCSGDHVFLAPTPYECNLLVMTGLCILPPPCCITLDAVLCMVRFVKHMIARRSLSYLSSCV